MYIVSDYIIKDYSHESNKLVLYAHRNLTWLTQRTNVNTLITEKKWFPYNSHSILNIEISYIIFVRKINKKLYANSANERIK